MSSPIYDLLKLEHVDGFDFDPSKAIKEKIIKESTTEIEFLDQFRPTYSILSRSKKMARETVFERLGKLGKKIIKKVVDTVEIQNVLGIVTTCIKFRRCNLNPHFMASRSEYS